MRPLTQFQPKIRETNLTKSAKFLSDLLTLFMIFSLRTKFGIEKLSSLL